MLKAECGLYKGTEPVGNKDTRRIQTRLQILLHRPLRDHEKDCGEVGKELQKRLGEGNSNHQGKGRKLKHSPDSSTLSFLGDKNFQVLNVDAVANKITVSGIAGYAERAIVGFYMNLICKPF